ncbi:hypothetical protein [Legionella tunisiensis]|uniref:hypothetical protein n=1 Tax=Legionella tunisiensis TaxID=1034944 RepID=UPI000302AB15|nr:hypothetical protein [Legionella tunisiensis]
MTRVKNEINEIEYHNSVLDAIDKTKASWSKITTTPVVYKDDWVNFLNCYSELLRLRAMDEFDTLDSRVGKRT